MQAVDERANQLAAARTEASVRERALCEQLAQLQEAGAELQQAYGDLAAEHQRVRAAAAEAEARAADELGGLQQQLQAYGQELHNAQSQRVSLVEQLLAAKRQVLLQAEQRLQLQAAVEQRESGAPPQVAVGAAAAAAAVVVAAGPGALGGTAKAELAGRCEELESAHEELQSSYGQLKARHQELQARHEQLQGKYREARRCARQRQLAHDCALKEEQMWPAQACTPQGSTGTYVSNSPGGAGEPSAGTHVSNSPGGVGLGQKRRAAPGQQHAAARGSWRTGGRRSKAPSGAARYGIAGVACASSDSFGLSPQRGVLGRRQVQQAATAAQRPAFTPLQLSPSVPEDPACSQEGGCKSSDAFSQREAAGDAVQREILESALGAWKQAKRHQQPPQPQPQQQRQPQQPPQQQPSHPHHQQQAAHQRQHQQQPPPPQQQQQQYKYNEVVRKQDERRALPAYECAQCKAFYAAVDTWGRAPVEGALPVCGHVRPQEAGADNGGWGVCVW